MEKLFVNVPVDKLNDLESLVFNKIIKNPSHVSQITIRDLAKECHVSTSTIIRMANRLGFKGWADFKHYLKNKLEYLALHQEGIYNNIMTFDFFLKRMFTDEYQTRITQLAKMIADVDYCLFVGAGNSGSLADYASKYFNNAGHSAHAIIDPYQLVQIHPDNKVLAFILSNSGETIQVIDRLLDLKQLGATVVAVTNHSDNTVCRLSDIVINYQLQDEKSVIFPEGKLTTQLPVMALVEQLAHRSNLIYRS